MSHNLRETLELLKEQLKTAESLEPEQVDQLRQVLHEIDCTLPAILSQQEVDSKQRASSLGSKLLEVANEFESSHPQITSIVGRVADQLAQIGI